ncbi:MAG: ligand-binding SRPBCC domain-containing protein [Psychromonas sp.]|jgi:ligand-binding SRPBCC domain-containing protein
MPVIKLITEINTDINIVFDLSRSIDLHKISTSQTNEEAIAGITSGLIELNESVTWRAKHFGVYQELTSQITEFHKPLMFVDEMTQGAFKSFIHIHSFEKIKNGTRMIDVFNYKSPLGILGILADRIFLKRYVTLLLVKRNLIIKEYAESGKWKEILVLPTSPYPST